MPFGIHQIAHYVPEKILGNDQLRETIDFDEEFLSQKLGINERRIAGPDETVADMGSRAAVRSLEESGLHAENLDVLIVVTQTPEYCLPQTSALVHEILDLPKALPVFDISLGCSGFVYGLSVATAFLESNGGDKGLLITADTYSKIMAPDDRATTPLFGDGAAATLISRDGLYVPGKFTFGSDGSRHKALIAPGSGTRKPEGPERLHMDGRAIYSFMMSEIPTDIDRCLEANELAKDDIDLWVFHQASKYMLESLGQQIGVPGEKLVVEMADIGNTTSSSIPIALERQVMNRDPLPRRVFISGFGVGLSWASTVLSLRDAKT